MRRRQALRRIGLASVLLPLAACSSAPEVPVAVSTPQPSAPPQPSATPLPSTAPVAVNAVQPSATTLGRYERLELTLDLAAEFSNPFDPAEIDVQGRFTAPDGTTVSVPGFYWQDYTSVLSGGTEQLTATGAPAWKVRFTPQQTGTYSYSVRVQTPGGSAESPAARFEVTTGQRHGFVRVDRRDAAYFAFDDGAPYLAIGENVGWYGAGGTADYERWFGKLHAAGANFARLWMPSWAQGIEWSDTGLGDYTKRLDRAWQLDRIFELAEQQEIYVMLSLLNHGAFSTTTNAEWDENPYNAALGGPCKTPEEFATSPIARELFKRRVRYIAARWGYSPQLMAWEWWNEVEWTPLAAPELLVPWITEMSAFLATVDPYTHLRTTSYARSGDDAVWKLPAIDIVQRHIYDKRDPAAIFPKGTKEMLALGKPALYGEFGSGADGADRTIDVAGVHIRNGIWAGLMSKGSGSGMTWWWDTYIDPLNLYSVFQGASAFWRGEDPAAAQYRPGQGTVKGTTGTALLLRSPERVLGWVKSAAYSFEGLTKQYTAATVEALKQKQELKEFNPTFPEIAGVSFTIKDLPAGAYTIEWWDAGAGTVLSTASVPAVEGLTTIDVPPFKEDLAFKLTQAT